MFVWLRNRNADFCAEAFVVFARRARADFDFFRLAIRPRGEICDTQRMVILMRNGGAIIGLGSLYGRNLFAAEFALR